MAKEQIEDEERRGPRLARLPVYRLSILGLLLAGFPIALMLGIDGQDGLAALRRHQLELLGFVATKPFLAALSFMLAYGGAVVVSLPGVALLTMLGGYLFGWLEGALYALIATTLASGGAFVLARGALAATVRSRAGPWVRRFAAGFRSNALLYMVGLHLVPVLPFGMVIALPAALGVRFRTFLVSTAIGILPGTLLLAHLGEGLGALLHGSGTPALTSLVTPQVLGPLAGLLALALLPLFYRWLTGRRRPLAR